MPDIIRLCYDSVKKMSGSKIVQLITFDNITDFVDQAEVTVHHRLIPAPILPDIRVPRHPTHASLYPRARY